MNGGKNKTTGRREKKVGLIFRVGVKKVDLIFRVGVKKVDLIFRVGVMKGRTNNF